MSKPDDNRRLDAGLDKESYEIKDELKIRKALEGETDWQLEFTKNSKFDYDLRVFVWDDNPRGPESKNLLGFIEVERTSKTSDWITGDIPDSWWYYSFLERKIRQYDHRFTGRSAWGDPIEDYQRTVYLKFNHSMDNCFMAPITTIYHDGTHTKRSDWSRTNTYRKLSFYHPDVTVGLDESLSAIQEYLIRQQNGQESILSYG